MMTKIFAANWKLHKTPKESRDFFSEFTSKQQLLAHSLILFFPPATSLEATSESLMHTQIEFGAQNCCMEAKGAFTGEVSAQVVKDLGGKWILLGHSERRKIFAEDDEMISKKILLVQSLALAPMLCIGETLQEREAGQTFSVIQSQLQKGLAHADRQKFLAVAYEPVWAIGTGKVATIEQVKEAHAQVRSELTRMGFSTETPILYGGSVKPDNAKELIRVPNVNGFLVGGASLEVSSFLEICRA